MTAASLTEEDIFQRARRIVSPEARTAYLDSACGDNGALRERVDILLECFRTAESFLESPAPEVAAAAPERSPSPTEQLGRVIGSYKLLEQIGEGGFGIVFLAEQERPIRRKAALKIIKPGMDTRQVVARFEAERQVLALMDHPNIAKVLDAGATDTGRPYFVMELVAGVPITEYCDQCQLTTDERLKLFVTVCQAMQHAHQKGVIHRDIKPGNVLVAIQDGDASPKIIDFGVAKAIEQRLTEQALTTAFAQMIGSPLYMSPEQAELSPLGIDTRSDIYSLGVLLYELVTGATPFDKDRLHEASYDELRRVIREEEPPLPSIRISTLAAELATTIAVRRRTEARRLSQAVRGELDWIVMKAIDKDRNRRYESAMELARDVQRFLQDEPVHACPPSAAYRFRKFARRYKGPVIAAALVSLAFVGGIIGTSWQAVRATKAQALAVQRLTQVEKSNEILGSIFVDLDPRWEQQGKTLRTLLGERLELAAAQLDAEAVGDPLSVARLQNTLGASMMPLGHSRAAISVFEKAHRTRQALLGPDHADTLDSLHNIAWAMVVNGQNERALALLEQVWRLRMKAIGPDDIGTVTTSFFLAKEQLRIGRRDEGLALLEFAQSKCQAIKGREHPMALFFTANLAVAYASAGRLEQATAMLEDTLAVQSRTLGADQMGTLITLHLLGIVYEAAGRTDEGLATLVDAVARSKKSFGTDHHETQACMDSLARAYLDRGDFARADDLLVDVLASKKQTMAADHPSLVETIAMLGWSHVRQDRFADADDLLADCLAIHTTDESASWQVFDAHRVLGASLLTQQRFAEAEPHLLKAYQGLLERESSLPLVAGRRPEECLALVVELYNAWGKPEQADRWRKQQMAPDP